MKKGQCISHPLGENGSRRGSCISNCIPFSGRDEKDRCDYMAFLTTALKSNGATKQHRKFACTDSHSLMFITLVTISILWSSYDIKVVAMKRNLAMAAY